MLFEFKGTNTEFKEWLLTVREWANTINAMRYGDEWTAGHELAHRAKVNTKRSAS